MSKERTKPKRKYRRSYSATMRLKICAEYLSGEAKQKGLTQKELCKRYNIGTRTLQYWLNEYKNDYEGLLDFYRFIMGDLAANGYRKAAEYLRDYAVDILTDAVGIKPPQSIKFNFDAILEMDPKTDGEDEIADGLNVIGMLNKN